MARSFRNLHPQVCSLENVMVAARAAMQGKMSGHAAARFHARWETHAVRLHEELTAGTSQPGKWRLVAQAKAVSGEGRQARHFNHSGCDR